MFSNQFKDAAVQPRDIPMVNERIRQGNFPDTLKHDRSIWRKLENLHNLAGQRRTVNRPDAKRISGAIIEIVAGDIKAKLPHLFFRLDAAQYDIAR